jgi:hypothetical protein
MPASLCFNLVKSSSLLSQRFETSPAKERRLLFFIGGHHDHLLLHSHDFLEGTKHPQSSLQKGILFDAPYLLAVGAALFLTLSCFVFSNLDLALMIHLPMIMPSFLLPSWWFWVPRANSQQRRHFDAMVDCKSINSGSRMPLHR